MKTSLDSVASVAVNRLGILKACCDNSKIRNVHVEMYFLRTMCRSSSSMNYRGLGIDQVVQRISLRGVWRMSGRYARFFMEFRKCDPNYGNLLTIIRRYSL